MPISGSTRRAHLRSCRGGRWPSLAGVRRAEGEANLEGTFARKLPTGGVRSHGLAELPGGALLTARAASAWTFRLHPARPEGELFSVTRRPAVRSCWLKPHHLSRDRRHSAGGHLEQAVAAGHDVTQSYVVAKVWYRCSPSGPTFGPDPPCLLLRSGSGAGDPALGPKVAVRAWKCAPGHSGHRPGYGGVGVRAIVVVSAAPVSPVPSPRRPNPPEATLARGSSCGS